jgi:UDP-2,3-diacylglucosamine pyrophosphatase LpxH
MIVVADSHMTRRDDELALFTRFLRERGGRASVVAHLGDLFNIWLGRPRFEMEHMPPVLDAFRDLRKNGVRTILVEGNRDFHARRSYEGDVFSEVTEETMEIAFGGRRIRMAHGDLVNVHDTQYRAWRRFSKSAAVWGAVGLLPSRAGIRLAERLESRLRGTNLQNKIRFPRELTEEYGDRAFLEGADLLLLGHFHQEHLIETPRGSIAVLPDWRSSHRYLSVAEDGRWGMKTWDPAEGGSTS